MRAGVPLEFIRELPESLVVTEAPSQAVPLVLECQLSRKPREPVKWLRNGKPLTTGRLPKGVSLDEEAQSTVHRLTFAAPLTEEDLLGQYTLQAENISSTANVDMKSKSASPSLSYLLPPPPTSLALHPLPACLP